MVTMDRLVKGVFRVCLGRRVTYVHLWYNCLRWRFWSLKTPPLLFTPSIWEPHTQSYIRSIRSYIFFQIDLIYCFIVFHATFSNISSISWRPVLVVEEAGVPGENHRPWFYDFRLRVECILFVIYKAGHLYFSESYRWRNA